VTGPRLKPNGSDPLEIDHWKGGVPPEALQVVGVIAAPPTYFPADDKHSSRTAAPTGEIVPEYVCDNVTGVKALSRTVTVKL
jgi:hypothetical protein